MPLKRRDFVISCPRTVVEFFDPHVTYYSSRQRESTKKSENTEAGTWAHLREKSQIQLASTLRPVCAEQRNRDVVDHGMKSLEGSNIQYALSISIIIWVHHSFPGLMGVVSTLSPLAFNKPLSSPSPSSLVIPVVMFIPSAPIVFLVSSAPFNTYHTSFFVSNPCKTPLSLNKTYRSPSFWK
jgi:hypothetical protein